MSIEIIAQSKSGKTVMFGTQEGRVINDLNSLYGKGNGKGGRYLVEYAPQPKVVAGETFMVPQKEYFDTRVDAMQFYRFQATHELFVEAKEAGLDDATAELVATRKMTLEEALGDMDCDAETFYMEDTYVNECEDDPQDDSFDPDLHGGEDDNTPPLEVLMAGGWAAWEHQNEKNAWLDSRNF